MGRSDLSKLRWLAAVSLIMFGTSALAGKTPQDAHSGQLTLVQVRKLVGYRISDYSTYKTPLLEWDRTSEECRNWVSAHRLACGENVEKVVKRLLDTMIYETEASLFHNLNRQIDNFFQLPSSDERHFRSEDEIVIGLTTSLIDDSIKSAEWIAYQLINGGPGYQNEYLRNKMLEGKLKLTDISSGAPVSKGVRRHFLLIDDTAYSGGQLSTAITGLHHTTSQSDLIHVFTQHSTSVAKELIENNVRGRKNYLGLGTDISSPQETLKHDPQFSSIEYLANEYYQPANLFYQFKKPDHASVSKFLIPDNSKNNQVKCTTKGAAVTCDGTSVEFRCIPTVITPYKSEQTRESMLAICLKNPEMHDCKTILDARKKLLGGTCSQVRF